MKNELKLALEKSVQRTKDDFVFIEPVCDFFRISYINQKRRIADDPICQTGSTKKYSELIFGDKRRRLCVDKRAFLRWIQIISVSIIHPNLRELFQEYQVAVFDYLYQGLEARQIQLEDIRNYAININNAINTKNHVMEYVGEQKRHRDLCLATPPEQWLIVKQKLSETKKIPEGTEKFKAINSLPSSVDELKRLRKNLQTDIHKNKNRLIYQSPNIQNQENPLPDGYRREKLKLLIKDKQDQINRINERLLELKKMEG